MELVRERAQVVENLQVFDSYRHDSDADRREYYCDRLRLGKKLVVGKIDGRYAFAPSRFAGYIGCTRERHIAFPYKHGTLTTQAISRLLGDPDENLEVEAAYVEACRAVGTVPSSKDRSYWLLGGEIQPRNAVRQGDGWFPDVVEEFVEGATHRVVVDAVERDAKARTKCLAHFGYSCMVCGLSFEVLYGEIGRGFIHVHHLRPISKLDGPTPVDPVADLRPVCPNCHAMLHRSDPPFSLEELRSVLDSTHSAPHV